MVDDEVEDGDKDAADKMTRRIAMTMLICVDDGCRIVVGLGVF